MVRTSFAVATFRCSYRLHVVPVAFASERLGCLAEIIRVDRGRRSFACCFRLGLPGEHALGMTWLSFLPRLPHLCRCGCYIDLTCARHSSSKVSTLTVRLRCAGPQASPDQQLSYHC